MNCATPKTSENLEQLLRLMKDEGLRITEQRRALLELLLETDKAMTVPQIFQELLSRDVQVDEASVYRSIKVLKDIKVVHELNQGQVSLCQHSTCGSKHLHMSWLCDQCGNADEPTIKNQDLESLQKILGFKRNQISHVRVNYLCKTCRTP
ncbi:MAG: transcriptional repressor [Bdellovibrionaceae bacterium]|nr:transcriptional repressor [Pseudobdellovibrionaceae bacterium]